MSRVLVIDDEAQVRKLLRKILEAEGYQVADAPNGKVGMEFCRVERFDLVITDIIMPEKEGIEVIGELLDNFPETKIIVISGGSRNLNADNLLVSAKKIGADCVISKPFNVDELLNEVRLVLSNKK
ncbi:MAG: response regulator [Candidatus Brocadiaceae bacterium]|nr:response regulator [Candidatus Brocadiaceae bacterium]